MRRHDRFTTTELMLEDAATLARAMSSSVHGVIKKVNEAATGCKALRIYKDKQPSSMPTTWPHASLLRALTSHAPVIDVREGVARFVEWQRWYYVN